MKAVMNFVPFKKKGTKLTNVRKLSNKLIIDFQHNNNPV